MHDDVRAGLTDTSQTHWTVTKNVPAHIRHWLAQNSLSPDINGPVQQLVEHDSRQFMLSAKPWPAFAQAPSDAPHTVLVGWQDISELHRHFVQQNQKIWMLWLLATLMSMSLVIFFTFRLQKSTASHIQRQHQQLLWSEKKLKALYTLSPLPILLNRLSDGAFMEANPAMEDLVGYSIDEIKSLSYWDLTPECYADDEQRQLESLRSTGRYGPYRKQYRHKEGHLIDIELNGMLFEQGDGEPMIWTIVQDLTERNRLEKMKGDFIATVSHELRTPLTSISGSLSLLLSGAACEQSPKGSKMLDIAYRNSKRLTALVNDLLDMEKLSTGKMDFRSQPLLLSDLLQEARDTNQQYVKEHGSTLIVENSEDVTIIADPQRIQQVLANLISNAAKFSPPGTEVSIKASRDKAYLRISVIDQGPGLSAEQIDQLFKRFAQLQNSGNKHTPGSGLGLAICREIIDLSGGNIGVDSKPGDGACFWFELPVARGENTEQKESKILIVEDDRDIAQTLQAVLQEAGFVSDVATDLATAWQLISDNDYSLITLDLRLQNEHGNDLFLKLRDSEATNHIPVLVISAYLEEGKLNLSAIANAVDWIEKPFSAEQVIEKIDSLLNERDWQIQPHILHVEDDADIVEIMRAHLASDCDYHSAGTLKEGVLKLGQSPFDLLLLDIGLPDGSGWELLDTVRKTQGNIPVVIFSAQEQSVIQNGKVSATFAKSNIQPAELVDELKSLLSH